MSSVSERYEFYRRELTRYSQSHLLAFWPELSEQQRERLLSDLDQIDFETCRRLIDSHVRQRPVIPVPQRIEPPACYGPEPAAGQEELYQAARRAGELAVRTGRVAAFTVAGGEGTRLGFDGPKGQFPISPVRSASLFQLLAEGLLGVERRYGRRPPWYIMTSDTNHEPTIKFFSENHFFGLPPQDVMFFKQGQMPVFLPDGRIAMEERYRVKLSPDGHGGSLRALAASGALADMRSRGIEVISYFQVDNPLVKVIDPLFIGLHLLTESEMSTKAVPKAHDHERVGVLCQVDGRLEIIEYSDLPDELARARNADGSRRFDAGNIAVHILSRQFVERLTQPGASVQLPWHRADKKVPVLDASGQPVNPDRPNVVKLEMLVFDAIPLARNPLVLYTRREEEFSPVKNAEGTDSPATARRDLIRRAAAWLEACGWQIPRKPDGEPAQPIEISPAYALDADDLRQRLANPGTIRPGEPFLLK